MNGRRGKLAVIITVTLVVMLAVGWTVWRRSLAHDTQPQGTPSVTQTTPTPSTSTPSAAPTVTPTPTASHPSVDEAENLAKQAFEARHSWGADADTDPATLVGHPWTDVAAAYAMGDEPSVPRILANPRQAWNAKPPEDNSDPTLATYGEDLWGYVRDVNLISGFRAHAENAECTDTGECTVTGTVKWLLWSMPTDSGYQSLPLGYDGQRHDDVWAWCPLWGSFTMKDTMSVASDGRVSMADSDTDWWLADPYYVTADMHPDRVPSNLSWRHDAIPVFGEKPLPREGAYGWRAGRVSGSSTGDSALWYGGQGEVIRVNMPKPNVY